MDTGLTNADDIESNDAECSAITTIYTYESGDCNVKGMILSTLVNSISDSISELSLQMGNIKMTSPKFSFVVFMYVKNVGQNEIC